MTTLPKTIQIFLPDGNARSIRIAEITSRTVQAIQVPRSKLGEAEARGEVKGVGVYFLLGESEESAKPLVYVGEAEDCYQRLKQHNASKGFWTSAVAITSKTQSFTKAHAKYLEWFCCEKVREAARYRLQNTSTPSKSYVPEPVVADLLDNFETIRVLLSTLGFPLFEAAAETADRRRLYRCKGRGAGGRGEYVEDGFVVLAGSRAVLGLTPSARESWISKIRAQLQDDGVLQSRDGALVFTEDYLFKSPSGAAAVVLGRHSNGWTEWRDGRGRTLDEMERKVDGQPQEGR